MNGLSVSAFAKRLGVSVSLVRRHIELGNLQAIDVGTGTKSHYIIAAAEYERVEREGLRQPAATVARLGRPTRDEQVAVRAKW